MLSIFCRVNLILLMIFEKKLYINGIVVVIILDRFLLIIFSVDIFFD